MVLSAAIGARVALIFRDAAGARAELRAARVVHEAQMAALRESIRMRRELEGADRAHRARPRFRRRRA